MRNTIALAFGVAATRSRLAPLALLLMFSASPALGHDPYASWMIPGTQTSCCNQRDCEPAESWRVAGDRYEAKWRGQWLAVPPGAVLRDVQAPDGRGHVCVRASVTPPLVLCFKPGAEG